MRPRRLLWQLYWAHLVVVVGALVVAGLLASASIRGFYDARDRADLLDRARLVENSLAAIVASGDRGAVRQSVADLGGRSQTRFTLIGLRGEVLAESDGSADSMDNHAGRPEVREALAGRVGYSSRASFTLGRHMTYVAVPLYAEGRLVAVLRTALPATAVEEAMRQVQGRLALIGLAVASVAAAISLIVSRRISRPLEEIERVAQRFAQGNLDQRIPLPRPREAAALAQTMNDMAAQLDERIRRTLEDRAYRDAILASMVEGVLTIDLADRLTSINQAAAALLQLDVDKAVGRTVVEVMRNLELQQLVARVLATREAAMGEVVLWRTSAQERVVQAHGTVLRDSQGQPLGVLVVLHDITQLKRLENIRRDFVANVSHELKTPLTAIQGYVETLLDGSVTTADDTTRFLGIVSSQAERLAALIDDLLTLSAVEQGHEQAQIALESGPICPVLEEAVEVCRYRADEKQMTIEIRCQDDLQARINAPLLKQAVVNLVDNAIKYSAAGRPITIEADADAAGLRIAVRDQGYGIGREHLSRVFERFYRVDRARSRQLGGTGLGLAIVKHIAQAHGGRATVESIVGEGSTFTIHLPPG